jgi:D-alanine-D-alanine ligase
LNPPSRTPAQLRIAVLLGGANTERDVSRSSGLAVARALRGLGHAVAAVDSALPPVGDHPPEAAYRTGDAADEEAAGGGSGPGGTAGGPPDLASLRGLRDAQEDGVLAPGLLPILAVADVVFITVFGDEGEAGATQRFLDRHGLRYTGPRAEVCELTFDKAATKRLLAAHGIPTPAWHVVRVGHEEADLGALELPGPWIVKPVRGGSTIGLSHVTERGDLPAAVALASAAGADALVEEYVPGRDFTVGALGDRVFAVVELLSGRTVMDYAAKYTPGGARKQAPADLPPRRTAEVRHLTAEVHRLLDVGETTSRSDFRLGPDGFTFLEVNPVPGMTPTSSYQLSAGAAGVGFAAFCEDLVRRALARPPAR